MNCKTAKKIISVIVLIAFICTNTAYGAPSRRSLFKDKKVDYKKLSTQREDRLNKKKSIFEGEDTKKAEKHRKEAKVVLSSHLKDLSQIHIPSELGRVTEVYESPSKDSRLIVHIQDLHTNPEAELNLASILEILLKDYNMGLVCSEGADGEVDTSSVSSFPDYEIREKTARLFINSGELTGEEYLSITKYPDLPIWGIEDRDIYFKNIIEFNRIMKFSPKSQVFISQAQKALDQLKSKIYSKELLNLDQKEVDYENEKIETDAFLKHLTSYVRKFDISTDKYRNISLLTEATEQEQKINQVKVMQESQNLLLNLQAKLSGRKLRKDKDALMVKAKLFREQKISPFSFYSYLKDLALKHIPDKISKYPNLNDFLSYLTKVNSLDSTKLFTEMEDLTYEVKMRLAKTDEQKTFIKALRNIKFLEGFFNLKVSNEELDYYLANRESHKVGFFKSFLKPALKKHDISAFIDYNPNLIDFHLQGLEDFYKTVRQRDVAMVRNSVSEIEKRDAKVASLVAGGFHTKGITKLLREKGYSYVVVSPYSSTDIDEENYHFLLSGKRKPIEELLKGLNDTLRCPIIATFVKPDFVDDFNNKVVPNIEGGKELKTQRILMAVVSVGVAVLRDKGIESKKLAAKLQKMFTPQFRETLTGDINVMVQPESIIIVHTQTKETIVTDIGDFIGVASGEKIDPTLSGPAMKKALMDLSYEPSPAAEATFTIAKAKKSDVLASNHTLDTGIMEDTRLDDILLQLGQEDIRGQMHAVYGTSFEEAEDLVSSKMLKAIFDASNPEEPPKNRAGWTVKNLKWLLKNPEKIQSVLDDAEEIRSKFKYIIFCGMGGSGLSVQVVKITFGEPGGYKIFSFRTTTPEEIKYMFDVIAEDAGSLEKALLETLVIPISKSGTTRETVDQKGYFEELFDLFKKFNIEPEDHMWVITDKGSPMDEHGYEQREIQLNGEGDIGGRFTSPQTLVFLLVLAISAPEKVEKILEVALKMNDIKDINEDTFIILGAYLYYMAAELGKDKLTLMVPKELQNLPVWAEQLIEESLGKEGKGISLFYDEDLSIASLKDVEDSDRVFLRINVGDKKTNDEFWSHLKKNRYPVFEIDVDDIDSLGGIMLGFQRSVITVAYLWDICAVDQEGVQDYKKILTKIMDDLGSDQKVEIPEDWKSVSFGKLNLYYDRLIAAGILTQDDLETGVRKLGSDMNDAPAVYAAAIIKILESKPDFEAKEFGFYGRMTEDMEGILQAAKTEIFTNGLKIASKISPAPDKLHSTEQNKQYGKDMWVDTLFMPDVMEQPDALEFSDNLIRAQLIAAIGATVDRGRKTMLITFDSTVKDAEQDVERFFGKVEHYLTRKESDVLASNEGISFAPITERERQYEELSAENSVEIGLTSKGAVYHRRSIAIPAITRMDDTQLDELADYLCLEIASTLSRIGAEGIKIKAPKELYQRIERLFTKGLYSRIPSYFSCIYETKFKIESADKIDSEDIELSQQESAPAQDYHRGMIVGMDVGASDVKVASFIEGRCIFAKEINWESYKFKNSDEHLSYFVTMVRLAKAAIEVEKTSSRSKRELKGKLKELAHNANTPLEEIESFIEGVYTAGISEVKLDGIGLSTAGAVVNGRITQEGTRAYRGIGSEEFWTKVAPMGRRISESLGGVPVGVLNDGDAAALSLAGTLGLNNVLALSLGTGLAAGYVDNKGQLNDYLGEMGKCSIDLSSEAGYHEGLRIRGALQQYTSQRGVLHLARKVWPDFDKGFEEIVARRFAAKEKINLDNKDDIVSHVKASLTGSKLEEFKKAIGNRPKLKYVQSKLELPKTNPERQEAEKIFKTIGSYLAVAVATSLKDLKIEHVVLFGACTSGMAGRLITESARKYLTKEIGDRETVNILLASEDDYVRQVGKGISKEFNSEFAARFGQTVGAAYMGLQVADGLYSTQGAPLSEEEIARRFSDSPEYGIHIQRARLEKGLADSRVYHDAIILLLKSDGLEQIKQSLEGARGKVIPQNSVILVVNKDTDDSVIQDAMRKRREEGTVPVIIYVQDDDIDGNLSAFLRGLDKLYKGGVNFDKERVVTVLTGGDGKRTYPLTASDGYGNKGFMSSINGEPNIFQAIRQSMQLLGENDTGIISMPTDRIFSITEPVKGLGEHGVQLLGGGVELGHPEFDYFGKIEVDSNGRFVAMYKRKSPQEIDYLKRYSDTVYHPVNNLTVYHLDQEAIERFVDPKGIPNGPDINLKAQDLNQDVGKRAGELAAAGVDFGFVYTGKETYITDLGTNQRYYLGCTNLLSDDILRQVTGYSFMQPSSIIDNKAVLGKDVVVEKGAVILGNTRINKGIVRKGAVIVNSVVDEIDAHSGSLAVALYRPDDKVIARADKVITDIPVDTQGTKRNIEVEVDIEVDPKKTWDVKQFEGFSYKDLKESLDYEEVERRHTASGLLKTFASDGNIIFYSALEGSFKEEYELTLDLSRPEPQRFKAADDYMQASILAELSNASFGIIESIIEDDPGLKEYFASVLSKPDNNDPAIRVKVSSMLPLTAVRYFNASTGEVELIFSQSYIDTLLKDYESHFEAVVTILAERYFHELGHDNELDLVEKERAEERKLIHRDIEFHKLVSEQIIGTKTTQEVISDYFETQRPAFKSGCYFRFLGTLLKCTPQRRNFVIEKYLNNYFLHSELKGYAEIRRPISIREIETSDNYKTLLDIYKLRYSNKSKAQVKEILDGEILKEAFSTGDTVARVILGVLDNRVLSHKEKEAIEIRKEIPPQVLVIGGGGGMKEVTLRACQLLGLNIKVGSPSTDDGGSTGKIIESIRPIFGSVSTEGDGPGVLADVMRKSTFADLLDYRPDKESDSLEEVLLEKIKLLLAEDKNRPLEEQFFNTPGVISFLSDQLNIARIIDNEFLSPKNKNLYTTFTLKGNSIRNLNNLAVYFKLRAYRRCGDKGVNGVDEEKATLANDILAMVWGLDIEKVGIPQIFYPTYNEAILWADYPEVTKEEEKRLVEIFGKDAVEEFIVRERKDALPARVYGQRFIDVLRHDSKIADVDVSVSKDNFKLLPRPSNQYIESIKDPRIGTIIVGAGSLFSSLVCQLAIDGVIEALINRKDAKKILLLNHVNMDEMNNYSVEDCVRMIERIAKKRLGRVVLFSEIFSDIVVNRTSAKEIDTWIQTKQKKREANEFGDPINEKGDIITTGKGKEGYVNTESPLIYVDGSPLYDNNIDYFSKKHNPLFIDNATGALFRWKVTKEGKSIYSTSPNVEYTHSSNDDNGKPKYLNRKKQVIGRKEVSLLRHVLVRVSDGKEFYFSLEGQDGGSLYVDKKGKEEINIEDMLYMNKYVYFLFRHENFRGMNEAPVTKEERAYLSSFIQPPELYSSRSEAGRQRGALYITKKDISYLNRRGMPLHNIHQEPLVSWQEKRLKAEGLAQYEKFAGYSPYKFADFLLKKGVVKEGVLLRIFDNNVKEARHFLKRLEKNGSRTTDKKQLANLFLDVLVEKDKALRDSLEEIDGDKSRIKSPASTLFSDIWREEHEKLFSITKWDDIFSMIAILDPGNTNKTTLLFLEQDRLKRDLNISIPKLMSKEELAIVSRYIATLINNGAVTLGSDTVAVDAEDSVFEAVKDSFDEYFDKGQEAETVSSYLSQYYGVDFEITKYTQRLAEIGIQAKKESPAKGVYYRFNRYEDVTLGLSLSKTHGYIVILENGEPLYKEQFTLDRKNFEDSNFIDYLVYSLINESINNAGRALRDIDAIGIAWPGAVRDNKMAISASILFDMKVLEFDRWDQQYNMIKNLADEISERFYSLTNKRIPVSLKNDGNVTAFGSTLLFTDLEGEKVLVLSPSDSLIGGFMDENLKPSIYLTELAKRVVDMSPFAREHDYRKIKGLDRYYASFRGIKELYPQESKSLEGIELVRKIEARLKEKNSDSEDAIEQLGKYLALSIVELYKYFDMKYTVLTGALARGRIGEMLFNKAQSLLSENFPEVPVEIRIDRRDPTYQGARSAAEFATYRSQIEKRKLKAFARRHGDLLLDSYFDIKDTFINDMECGLDLSRSKGQRFSPIGENALNLTSLLNDALDNLEGLVEGDADLKEYLQDLFLSPDNRAPPIKVMVSESLRLNSIRYYNFDTGDVEIIFSAGFIKDLLLAYPTYPQAVKTILSERLFHELGHANVNSTVEGNHLEENSLVEMDRALNQLVKRTGLQLKIDEYLTREKPQNYRSGYYFREILQQVDMPDTSKEETTVLASNMSLTTGFNMKSLVELVSSSQAFEWGDALGDISKVQKLDITETKDDAELRAAQEIANLIKEKNARGKKTFLGLATGGTQEGVYKKLIEITRKEKIDWSNVVIFALDEYVWSAYGYSREYREQYYNKESYRHFLYDHILTSMIRDAGLKDSNIHLMDGLANVPELEAEIYEDLIMKSTNEEGLDLQLLGIGEEGHIAFIEAMLDISLEDFLKLKTQVVELISSTINANSRYFDGNKRAVPPYAMSQGISTILKAKKILLVATGPKKRYAIKASVAGKITPEVPASVLQDQDRVTFIVDKDAARDLIELAKDQVRHKAMITSAGMSISPDGASSISGSVSTSRDILASNETIFDFNRKLYSAVMLKSGPNVFEDGLADPHSSMRDGSIKNLRDVLQSLTKTQEIIKLTADLGYHLGKYDDSTLDPIKSRLGKIMSRGERKEGIISDLLKLAKDEDRYMPLRTTAIVCLGGILAEKQLLELWKEAKDKHILALSEGPVDDSDPNVSIMVAIITALGELSKTEAVYSIIREASVGDDHKSHRIATTAQLSNKKINGITPRIFEGVESKVEITPKLEEKHIEQARADIQDPDLDVRNEAFAILEESGKLTYNYILTKLFLDLQQEENEGEQRSIASSIFRALDTIPITEERKNKLLVADMNISRIPMYGPSHTILEETMDTVLDMIREGKKGPDNLEKSKRPLNQIITFSAERVIELGHVGFIRLISDRYASSEYAIEIIAMNADEYKKVINLEGYVDMIKVVNGRGINELKLKRIQVLNLSSEDKSNLDGLLEDFANGMELNMVSDRLNKEIADELASGV